MAPASSAGVTRCRSPYRKVGLTWGWAAGPGEKRKISGCLPGKATSRHFPPEALVEG